MMLGLKQVCTVTLWWSTMLVLSLTLGGTAELATDGAERMLLIVGDVTHSTARVLYEVGCVWDRV